MTMHVMLDDAFGGDLATISGWGDFCRWVYGLDATSYGELAHLVEYGWSQESRSLSQQLDGALTASKPAIDVASIAAGLAAVLKHAGDDSVLIVTDQGQHGAESRAKSVDRTDHTSENGTVNIPDNNLPDSEDDIEKKPDPIDKKLWRQCLAAAKDGGGEVEGCTVKIVDGAAVKLEHYMDFVEAGNGYRYPDFIPKNEIWLDGNIDQKNWPFILYHEGYEIRLMAGGEKYNGAHKRANTAERALRELYFKPPAGTEKGLFDNVNTAGRWLADKWKQLEERYGRKTALSMAVAMIATAPLPGSIPAIIAAAEAIRGLRGKGHRPVSRLPVLVNGQY